MSDDRYPIDETVRRTGLTAHLLRVWEKRYGAVVPERTASGRRLYTDAQVERLIFLRQLTQAGQSIGFVARLHDDALRKLVNELRPQAPSAESSAEGGPANAVAAQEWLEACLTAVRAFDSGRLEDVLQRAETRLGGQGMLKKVVSPLAAELGERWRAGDLTAAHEHFATAILRVHLGLVGRSFSPAADAPVLCVATPLGQLHELGALMVSTLASNLGWRSTYLGASLPAAEIAGAAAQQQARAVALSLVYPADDPGLGEELTRLRGLLPPRVSLLIGGRAAAGYGPVLDRIGARRADDLTDLAAWLDGLRVAPLGA